MEDATQEVDAAADALGQQWARAAAELNQDRSSAEPGRWYFARAPAVLARPVPQVELQRERALTMALLAAIPGVVEVRPAFGRSLGSFHREMRLHFERTPGRPWAALCRWYHLVVDADVPDFQARAEAHLRVAGGWSPDAYHLYPPGRDERVSPTWPDPGPQAAGGAPSAQQAPVPLVGNLSGGGGATAAAMMWSPGVTGACPLTPLTPAPGTPTADFRARQLYLAPYDPATQAGGIGLGAVPGAPTGFGRQLTVALIDRGHQPGHEDTPPTSTTRQRARVMISGVTKASENDHGTASLAVLAAQDNGVGIVGAVPDAAFVLATQYPDPTQPTLYLLPDAIDRAVAAVGAGGVVLIEDQSYGRPVEVEPSVHAAIYNATAAGVHVVEPAGNLGYDLDAMAAFQAPHVDSGAVVAGGGSGQAGSATHYALGGYGARVDVQGWAGGVVTATAPPGTKPGATLQDAQDRWYTCSFGGTSSASAVVAGAVAVGAFTAARLEWHATAAGLVATPGLASPTEPALLRSLLRQTGAGQEGYLGAPIGPLPQVPALLAAVRAAIYERYGVVGAAHPVAAELSAIQIGILARLANGQTYSAIASSLVSLWPAASSSNVSGRLSTLRKWFGAANNIELLAHAEASGVL